MFVPYGQLVGSAFRGLGQRGTRWRNVEASSRRVNPVPTRVHLWSCCLPQISDRHSTCQCATCLDARVLEDRVGFEESGPPAGSGAGDPPSTQRGFSDEEAQVASSQLRNVFL